MQTHNELVLRTELEQLAALLEEQRDKAQRRANMNRDLLHSWDQGTITPGVYRKRDLIKNQAMYAGRANAFQVSIDGIRNLLKGSE